MVLDSDRDRYLRGPERYLLVSEAKGGIYRIDRHLNLVFYRRAPYHLRTHDPWLWYLGVDNWQPGERGVSRTARACMVGCDHVGTRAFLRGTLPPRQTAVI